MKPMAFPTAITRRFWHNSSSPTCTYATLVLLGSPKAATMAVDVVINYIAGGSASTDTTVINKGLAAPYSNAVLRAVISWVGVAR